MRSNNSVSAPIGPIDFIHAIDRASLLHGSLNHRDLSLNHGSSCSNCAQWCEGGDKPGSSMRRGRFFRPSSRNAGGRRDGLFVQSKSRIREIVSLKGDPDSAEFKPEIERRYGPAPAFGDNFGVGDAIPDEEVGRAMWASPIVAGQQGTRLGCFSACRPSHASSRASQWHWR